MVMCAFECKLRACAVLAITLTPTFMQILHSSAVHGLTPRLLQLLNTSEAIERLQMNDKYFFVLLERMISGVQPAHSHAKTTSSCLRSAQAAL